MTLRLQLDLAAGSRWLAVDIDPSRPVAELREALLRHAGAGSDLPALVCRRTGRRLDPGETLRQAGLRAGDRLAFAPDGLRPPGEPTPVVDLLVAGGPGAGRRHPLAAGAHRVGRSPACEVVVDDPTVSSVHVAISVGPTGSVLVRDTGSTNGTLLDGAPLREEVALDAGQVVALGATLLAFAAHTDPRPAPPPDDGFQVPFNRPPRVMVPAPALTFHLDAPRHTSVRQRLPLISALVPLALGGAMFYITKQVFMLLFAAMSPLMVVGSLLEGMLTGRGERRRAAAQLDAALRDLKAQMGRSIRAAERRLRSGAVDLATLVRRAETLDESLWERRPANADFLDLRLGWGDRPSGADLRVDAAGDPGVEATADDLLRRFGTLRAVPMVLPLRATGSLGISGDRDRVEALARALLLQVATLHSPDDVVLAAAVPEGDAWTWLGWLPHARVERSPLGLPLVGQGEGAAELLQRLVDLVARRRQEREEENAGTATVVVAVLHEAAGLPRGLVGSLLAGGPAQGIHVVWVGGGERRDLPGGCGAVVDLDAGTPELRLTLPASGRRDGCVSAEQVGADVALETALALSGIRDAAAGGGPSDVPDSVSLPAVLGLGDRPGARIEEWWRREDPLLRAPVGVGLGGEVVEISLRQDGPHALVGGMTGSGKSELLQALVASLATRHSPRHLSFLLVDYKGGAAFKDCVHLPHTVGFVTDLDGHLVNRALTSLRAELRRRESILRQTGTTDLATLQRRYPDLAPPSLVIVVDELAALAVELPEFIDGMVDIAQRGRSLGIHLVLATQRPAGVINDRIRANTNLRISLRFSDEAESRDIVGTGAAATPGLPPGRAFARIGPSRVVELQAAYASGRTRPAAQPAGAAVRDLDAGSPRPRVGGGTVEPAPDGASDLVELVALLNETNRRLGIRPPPRPWLPTLPEMLPLASFPPQAAGQRGPRAALGLVDEPAGQRQVPLDFALEDDGSLLVYGTSGAGKTTLLRSIAVSVASAHPPADVQLYALDFATRGLRSLEALPHCGGVVVGEEPDRVSRLLWMLEREVERRRDLLAASAAASLGEYRAAHPGEPAPPHLLVLLDGYPGFAAASQEVDQGAGIAALRVLVAEGRAVGIAFVITSDRQAPFLSALSASVSRRVILRMATDDEYAYLGLSRTVYRDVTLPPGRGFTEKGLEVQCACPGESPPAAAQVAAVTAIGAELRRRHGADQVPPVRLLPVRVSRDSLPEPGSALEAVIGLEDRTLAPVRLDLSEGHLLIAGPRRSGRTTALATLALSVARRGEVALHLLADRANSDLRLLDVWTSTALGGDACAEAARRLAADLREAAADGRPQLVIVDDGENLVDAAANRDGLDWLAQRGPEHGVRIVAAVESQAAQRAFAPWLVQVLRERQGILLDPSPGVDGALLGVRLPPGRPGAMPSGRGYLVRQGLCELVQVAGS
jgi:DNA segregation ATPase FtsK/SpoIIIE, S-DNA-T family